MSVTEQTPGTTSTRLDIASLNRLVSASADSGTTDILSPFDDSVLGRVPDSTDHDVALAFDRARAAQVAWAKTGMRARTAILLRFGRLVLHHESDLLDLIQLETGKSRSSAFEEIADVVLWSSYLAKRGPKFLAEKRRRGAIPVLTRTVERRVPKGVIGVITPWNYPLTLPTTDSLPALLAGNAVVLKPDHQTPYTALRMLQLLREAGLPRDVLQVVVGAGSTIGSAVIQRADFIMFTGSTATGKQIATQCSERLIGFSAELGGKNPMLVLDDADVDRAAAGAVQACFSNSGQLCISIERIYVHESVWDEFTAKFTAHVDAMRVARGLDWDADMGSLVSRKQFERVSGMVEDAKSKGARALAGGWPLPELGLNFYAPTVLTDVVPGMDVYAEETFGPVVSLYRVTNDDEAVSLANASEYGLNASVWSRSRGETVARQLQTGTVNINDGYAAAWGSFGAPMGGMKKSGLGRRHGGEGIRKYTDAQTIAQQRLVSIGGPAGMSKREWAEIMSAGVRLLRHFM